MATGENIKASEYNAIRAKVIALLGTGSITRGYGQALQSTSPVFAITDTITKDQWDKLRYDIINLKLHQDGLEPSIVTLAESAVISYGAGHPNTNYSTLADSADTNRFNIGTGQYLLSTVDSETTTSVWTSSATCEITVTFSTSEDARFFFNSGGQIRLSGSRSGGSTTLQNGAWTNVLSAMGSVILKASTGPGVSFYTLTSSWQDLYSFTMSFPYSLNNVKVQARCDISDNSSAGAKIVYLKVVLTDNYTDPATSPHTPTTVLPIDQIDGVLEFVVEELVAYGTMVPSGTFTVNSPSSYSMSPISVS